MTLLLFNRFLVRRLAADPDQAVKILTAATYSIFQKWVVASAASQWTATVGNNAPDLPALTQPAQRCESVADIVMNLPGTGKRLSPLLRDFAAVGNSLAHINDAHTAAVAHRVLDHNRAELDTLKISAGLLKRPELSAMAAHWQRLIHTHAEQMEQSPRQVLAGAYQAGSALETNSSLFRGRHDLFALASEVYANPQRAETLLLIAQQRMGKSSALMQFSAQLPDAHVVIVDCQRAITGAGDDLFAIGLSQTIINEEKRRTGGVRLSPLTEADVEKHPLHRLNQWLETYADKVGKKRVLLCLDEFDKLIISVAAGKLSRDVLGLLRGLSQARGWMVLYSGQYELDNFTVEFAEYLKNVRRVRVSYLKADEARDLLTNPVPDFALTWEAEAVERALYWSGCQPFLLQMIGSQVVDLLSPTERRTVMAADVENLVPTLFDAGRYYFHSIENIFSEADKRALQEIARTGKTTASTAVLNRLADREYLEKGEEGAWRFRVPLLAEWQRRQV